jgi:hypothetical protein
MMDVEEHFLLAVGEDHSIEGAEVGNLPDKGYCVL